EGSDDPERSAEREHDRKEAPGRTEFSGAGHGLAPSLPALTNLPLGETAHRPRRTVSALCGPLRLCSATATVAISRARRSRPGRVYTSPNGNSMMHLAASHLPRAPPHRAEAVARSLRSKR